MIEEHEGSLIRGVVYGFALMGFLSSVGVVFYVVGRIIGTVLS